MTRTLTTSGLVALAASCILLLSCAGQKARDNVLIPSLEAAWASMRVEAERGGLVTPAQLDTFQVALQDRNKTVIVASWPPIRPSVAAGIKAQEAAGEIGPGVAASKWERLENFDEAIDRIAERMW